MEAAVSTARDDAESAYFLIYYGRVHTACRRHSRGAARHTRAAKARERRDAAHDDAA